ncbi:hypothetical protein Leryth_021962 [Lithospermum erythrorhizon]|nr:hypothetical protein Leryth_021962 [Lithospermum erythrorhizon]
MGAACCCLRAEYADLTNPDSAVYQNWFRLQGFLQNFFHRYTLLLQRGDEHGPTTSTQGTGPLTSTSSMDNSLVDMYRSPPRPMPYDAHPRNIDSRQEGVEAKREKVSTNVHEETEPLRDVGDESPESVGNKWNESACEKGSKYTNSVLSHSLHRSAATRRYPFYYTESFLEECPTCLEEYTIDNPKIFTKCSHHFHLGCIYEWMERSDKCPVCGKVISKF